MKRLLTAWSLAVGLLVVPSVRGASPGKAPPLPDGVRTGTYQGWSKSLFLEARAPDVLAVVTPAVGGRIMYYGLHSQNLLFELPGSAGKTLAKDKEIPWVGGYQCGVGLPDQAPAGSEALHGTYSWSAPREFFVRLTGPAESETAVLVGKDILMDPETGDLGIEHRLKNGGTQPFTGRLWGRTQCRSGGFVIVPVRRGGRFPAGWALGKPGSANLETARPQSENVTVKKGILVARGIGAATHLAVESEAGWIAYATGRSLFVQYLPVESKVRSAEAPPLEVRYDLAMTELRMFSPVFTLAPGAEHVVPAKWALEGLDKEVGTPDQARALAAKIPASPFRR